MEGGRWIEGRKGRKEGRDEVRGLGGKKVGRVGEWISFI